MADEIPARGPARLEPISVVWHTFAAPQTLLILAILLALTLAVTGLIPQTSLDGSEGADSWLTVERGPLARYADIVGSLGLLDLSQSFWLRLLLGLATLALIVRAVDAAEMAWHAGRREEWQTIPTLPWLHRAQQVDLTTSVALDEVREIAIKLLEEEGYDWADVEENDRSELVAVYHPGRLWLRPLLYAALLVAGAGLAVAMTWGWHGEAWQPLPLEIQAVGHDTTYAVRLDAFDLRFHAQGQLAGYRSRVTWLRDGAEVQPDVAGIGQPARLDGVTVRQISYAPVARLRAQSGDGRTLLLQMPGQPTQGREVVTVRFGSADDQPLVFVPQFERFFALVFEPVCGAGRPAVHIYQIEQAGQQRQRVATLHDSGQITLNDVQLDVELSYVPLLRLDYRPGMSVAFAGFGAALIVLIALWLLPARLLSLRAAPGDSDTTRVEVKISAGARAALHLDILTERLEEAMACDD